jgi:16S rRNA (cytosine1402-N4)-methyltransferase
MNFFDLGLREGIYADISHKRLVPSPAEQRSNPRSKSAVLRWAIKK